MEALTLGSIFARHLGFPGHRAGRLGAEKFASRLAARAHAFAPAEDDPAAWVERFFEAEQPFEKREAEFVALGAADHAPTVLQVDLDEREYLVIEDDDEVVVVSEMGSLVLARTPELTARLKAAELPASSGTPSSAYREPGDRAYYVGQSGKVSLLDARLVAQTLAQAPTPRVEPLPRVAAPSRLSAFEPTPRPPVAPKVTFAAEQVRSLAAAAVQGPETQVLLVERTETKLVGGRTAVFWQRLTGALTEGGRVRENLGRTLAGASAVALGRQTYAVRAGAVTALVQRPVAGLGARAEAAERGSADIERRARAASFVPRWARDLFDERPRGHGFWIAPAAPGAASERPEWVGRALAQAHRWRERAREEARGRLEPPMPKTPVAVLSRKAGDQALVEVEGPGTRTVPRTLDRPGTAGAFGELSLAAMAGAWAGRERKPLGAGEPSGEPLALSQSGATERTLPEIQVHSTAAALEDTAGQPWSMAGALPASTLQALYTGLERTAAAEGHRIASVDVAFEPRNRLLRAPTDAASAFVEARFSAPAVTSVQVQTERLPPGYLTAPFAAGGLRVGRDLSDALDRSVQRSLVARPARPASTTAEGIANAFGHVTMTPRVAATAVTLPAAVSTAMAANAAPARLSALAWLDWAISNAPFAHAKSKSSAIGSALAAGSPADEGATGFGAGNTGTLPGSGSAAAEHAPAALGQPRSLPDSVQSHLDRATGSGAGMRPTLAPSESGTPDLVRASLHDSVPAGEDPFGTPGVTRSGAGAVPLFSATGPTLATASALAAGGGARGPESLVAALPLLQVHLSAHDAAPASAERAAEDGASDVIVIGVPLYVRMAEARMAPDAAHALSDQAPEAVAVGVPASAREKAGSDTALEGHQPSAGRPMAASPFAASGERSGGVVAVHEGEVPAPHALPAAPVPGVRDGHRTPLEGRAPEMAVVTPPASSRTGALAPTWALGEPGSSVAQAGAEPGAVPGGVGAKVRVPARRGEFDAPLESRAPGMPVVTLAASSRAPGGFAQGEGASAEQWSSRPAGGAHPVRSPSAGPATDRSGPTASEPHAEAISTPSAVTRTGSGTATRGRTGGPGAVSSAVSVGSGSLGESPSARERRSRQRSGHPSGVLRFFYPSEPRWWALTGPRTASGAATTVLASASEVPALVTERRDQPPSAAADGWSPAGLLPSASSAGGTPAGSLASPAAFGARGARVNGRSAPGAAVGGSSGLSTPPRAATGPSVASGYATIGAKPSVAPLELGSVREKDLAYVAVTPDGEAKLVTKSAAAQLATRSRTGLVEMTVVAGIAPQAPSLEDLATAGHEQPHARGKLETQARSAHGKTDALSLQGTIDSLAQRIYHRLKRRLESDRERFGG